MAKRNPIRETESDRVKRIRSGARRIIPPPLRFTSKTTKQNAYIWTQYSHISMASVITTLHCVVYVLHGMGGRAKHTRLPLRFYHSKTQSSHADTVADAITNSTRDYRCGIKNCANPNRLNRNFIKNLQPTV